LGMKEPFYVSESDLVKYKWAKMESFFKLPSPDDVRKCPERVRGSRASSATSKFLKFGFLDTKESFFVHESGLLKYKWAKMEYIFQSPNSVRSTEMP
jgi:hypothetical protein